MKTISVLSIVLLLFLIPCQADPITPADAQSHIGETVTVKGTVDEVKASAKAMFLDFGRKYSNQEFTAVTFNTSFADALKAHQGKTISVTGEVQMYKGEPEIVVNDLAQISK